MMTREQLYEALNDVNHSREKRNYYATMILEKPSLFPILLEILFMVDDKASNRAGWLVEFACKKELSILFPHLDTFTDRMSTVHIDSALRPVAKICEYLALAYYKAQSPLAQKYLTPQHKEKMIEAGFDWLITEQKVAVKAYTLTTLFWLGTEVEWIHPELKRVMEADYAKESAAFKARCRHTIKAINTFEKRKLQR